MKLAEVAILIGYISQTDNRDATNPYAVQAWHDALEPWVTLEDAKTAVIHHRRNSTAYLGVEHINEHVRILRKARVSANQIVPEMPPGLHQAQERAWILSFWDAVKDNRADPQAAADEAMSIVRPDHPQIENKPVLGQIRALGASKAIPERRPA